MFKQTFVPAGSSGRQWATLVALSGQFTLVGALVALPTVHFENLPHPELAGYVVVPLPPPAPPARSASAANTWPVPRQDPVPNRPETQPARIVPREFDYNDLVAPGDVARPIAIIEQPELAPAITAGLAEGVLRGVPGGVPGGMLNGILGGIPNVAALPPDATGPAVEPEPATPPRVNVGGDIQQARLIHLVKPDYPELARRAGVHGLVLLRAIVATDGTIQNIEVISGSALLVPAAVEAVSQWRYTPALLNGRPVEVKTQIEVKFNLVPE